MNEDLNLHVRLSLVGICCSLLPGMAVAAFAGIALGVPLDNPDVTGVTSLSVFTVYVAMLIRIRLTVNAMGIRCTNFIRSHLATWEEIDAVEAAPANATALIGLLNWMVIRKNTGGSFGCRAASCMTKRSSESLIQALNRAAADRAFTHRLRARELQPVDVRRLATEERSHSG